MLFNYREWLASFALAAGNFLKTVPKGLEASTCTELVGVGRGACGERGWDDSLDAPESGQRGMGPGPGGLGSLSGHDWDGLALSDSGAYLGRGGFSFSLAKQETKHLIDA